MIALVFLTACLPHKVHHDASVVVRGPISALSQVEPAAVVELPWLSQTAHISCGEGFTGLAEQGRASFVWTGMPTMLARVSSEDLYVSAGGACDVTEAGKQIAVTLTFRALLR